jgi:hypothetical protein
MAGIYPLAQTLFVNKQNESASYVQTHNRNADMAKPVSKQAALEGEFIKTGNSASFSDAQHIFERANQYAQMSSTAQNGLQAYTSLDTERTREAVRHLMGVDLYA